MLNGNIYLPAWITHCLHYDLNLSNRWHSKDIKLWRENFKWCFGTFLYIYSLLLWNRFIIFIYINDYHLLLNENIANMLGSRHLRSRPKVFIFLKLLTLQNEKSWTILHLVIKNKNIEVAPSVANSNEMNSNPS